MHLKEWCSNKIPKFHENQRNFLATSQPHPLIWEWHGGKWTHLAHHPHSACLTNQVLLDCWKKSSWEQYHWEDLSSSPALGNKIATIPFLPLSTNSNGQWCSNSTGTTTGWRQYHAQCKGAGPGTNTRYKMLSCPPHLIQRCEFLNNSSRGWKISTRRLLIYMEVGNTNSKTWTQKSSGLPSNLSFDLLFIPHSIEREVDHTPGSCDTSTQETQTTTTNRTYSHLKLSKNPKDLFTVWKKWEFCLD